MQFIKLASCDGKLFRVRTETMTSCAGTIRTMITDLGSKPGEEAVIPLPNIKSTILEKVIEWAKQKMGEGQTANWDEEFFRVDLSTLLGLILAADFLDMRTLYLGSCKAVATLIRGRNAEEVRDMFSIPNEVDNKIAKGLQK